MGEVLHLYDDPPVVPCDVRAVVSSAALDHPHLAAGVASSAQRLNHTLEDATVSAEIQRPVVIHGASVSAPPATAAEVEWAPSTFAEGSALNGHGQPL